MAIKEKLKKYTGEDKKFKGSWIIAIVLCAAAFVASFFIFPNKSEINYDADSHAIGQKIRALWDAGEGKEVINVNGSIVYERDVEITIADMGMRNHGMKDEQLRSYIIKMLTMQQVLLYEFDNSRLEITKEEYDKYISEQKAAMQEIVDGTGKKQQAADYYKNYISGLGYSFADYWTCGYTTFSMTKMIKIDKISLKISKDEGLTNISNQAVARFVQKNYDAEKYNITVNGEKYDLYA